MLGKLLEGAQWDDEVPFMLRLRKDRAAVAAPRLWFERACRALDEQPEVSQTSSNFGELRNQLVDMCERVMFNGEFIELPRLGHRACVLVPIPWYKQIVELIGHPAGDPPDPSPEHPGVRVPVSWYKRAVDLIGPPDGDPPEPSTGAEGSREA